VVKEAEGEPEREPVGDTVEQAVPGSELPEAEALLGALALLLAPA
jgi:hypothetical protein